MTQANHSSLSTGNAELPMLRILWTDYEITREELSECHTLCHGNWIEIERKYKYIQELKKILSDHEIPYLEEYEIE